MPVGCGDEAELKGVHPDAVRLGEPLGQGVADEVAPGNAAVAAQGAFACAALAVGGIGGAHLFEIAELVRRAEHVPHAVATLGVALHLVHLNDGLHRCPQPGHFGLLLLCLGLAVFDGEHMAVREVGVVGDRQDVAARAGVEALAAQISPEPDGARLVVV